MKFKILFYFFNILVITSFAIIIFIPTVIFWGERSTLVFWLENWYILLIMLIVFIVVNLYFISNWKVINLVETESWGDLINLLEHRIYTRKHLSKQNVKLLISSSINISNLEYIMRLEREIHSKKPNFYRYFAMEFAIPYIIDDMGQRSEEYLGRVRKISKVKSIEWIELFYGISLMVQKMTEYSEEIFFKLLKSKDPNILLIALKMLEDSQQHHVVQMRDDVQRQLHLIFPDEQTWISKLDKSRSKYIGVNLAMDVIMEAYQEFISPEKTDA